MVFFYYIAKTTPNMTIFKKKVAFYTRKFVTATIIIKKLELTKFKLSTLTIYDILFLFYSKIIF